MGRHRTRLPVYVKAVRIAGAGGLVAGVFFVVLDDSPPKPSEAVAVAVLSDVPAEPSPIVVTTTAPIPTPIPTPVPTPAQTPKRVVVVTPPPVVQPPVTTVAVVVPTTTAEPPPPPPPEPEPKKEEAAPVSREADADPKGDLLAAGMTFVGRGIPYVWGGKTTAGMDCSGFIWNALKKAGYKVPYRNSDALRAWAKKIPASAARPGDLVFWPGHVGIYAGNGRVVDSGTKKGPSERRIWGSPSYGRIP